MPVPGKESRHTVLVIDDERDIVQTIKGNLELDSYEVLCAYDGRSGISMAKKHRPDVVILDLNLPDIDGVKACEIMRREFAFPIIMLTARDGISDRVLGLECGADDYMVKPFHFLELSARIKAALKRVERSLIKNHYAAGGIEIDFKSRRVSIRDRETMLTRTEFDLLGLFVSFPDEVLSREFIQSQVWRDSQLYHHSRALDVHVQRLRKKVELDPEQPEFIVTVAGVGYKFCPPKQRS